MIKQLTIFLLLFSVAVFGQDDKKGTIKVKKVEVVKEKIDTTTKYSSSSIFVYTPIPQASYGQLYDRQPEYTGGDTARIRFINSNLIAPDCYKCKGTTSLSTLTLLINDDGAILDVTVKEGALNCPQCDAEAIRVAKLMPKWIPAQLDGKNIKIKWDLFVRIIYLK